MSYRERRQQARRGGGLSGIKVLKQGCGVPYYSPSWDNHVFKPTVFRPIGPVTDDGTTFLPWRIGPNAGDYGEWIEVITVFKGGTSSRLTLLTTQSSENPEEDKVVFGNSPADKLYDAWYRGKESHPHWIPLGDGKAGRGPAITQPSSVAVIQGALLEHNGKNMWSSPILPCCLGLPYSAMRGLESVLDEAVPGYAGDPNDMARWVVGDLLSPVPGQGKILKIANSATWPQEQAVNTGPAYGAGPQQQDSKKSEFNRYEVRIEVDVHGIPVNQQTGRLVVADQPLCWRPWETILNYMTDEEMAEELCRSFADQPDLLEYAFGNSNLLPSWFSHGQARQVNVPAQQAPQQQVPSQAPPPPPPPVQQAPQQQAPQQQAPQQQAPQQQAPQQQVPQQQAPGYGQPPAQQAPQQTPGYGQPPAQQAPQQQVPQQQAPGYGAPQQPAAQSEQPTQTHSAPPPPFAPPDGAPTGAPAAGGSSDTKAAAMAELAARRQRIIEQTGESPSQLPTPTPPPGTPPT